MVFPWFSHGFPMVMARYPQIIVIVMAVWEWFPLQVASFQWPISDVRSLKFDPWHPCLQNRGLANMWQGWGFTSSLATLSLWDLVCLKLQYQTRKHEMIPHFAQFKKSFITANLRCSVKKQLVSLYIFRFIAKPKETKLAKVNRGQRGQTLVSVHVNSTLIWNVARLQAINPGSGQPASAAKGSKEMARKEGYVCRNGM